MVNVREHQQIERESPRPAITRSVGLRIWAQLQAAHLHRETRGFAAFLVAGGLSAIVTLAVTSRLTEGAHLRFLWSAIIGMELGILVNFAANDRLSFQDLAGHRRTLIVRLSRFHLTCATGQLLILLAALALHDLAGWQPAFAQGLPIILATGINCLMHRFWTYRGARNLRPSRDAAVSALSQPHPASGAPAYQLQRPTGSDHPPVPSGSLLFASHWQTARHRHDDATAALAPAARPGVPAFRWPAAPLWQHAAFLVLLGWAIALHAANLGHTFIAPWDESIHAVVAEHVAIHPLQPMLYQIAALSPSNTTDWTSAHIWLHIPPLGLWASGLSMRLLGDTPLALRLPGVLFVAIGMIATYLLGRRLYGGPAGLTGAAAIGFAPYVLLLSQGYVFGDITDTPLLALTPLAVLALVYGYQSGCHRWLVAAGALQGLGYLTKGAFSLAPLGVALTLCASDYLFVRAPAQEGTSAMSNGRSLAAMTRQDWHQMGIGGLLTFIAAATLIAGPYNLYIAHAFPLTYHIENRNWIIAFFQSYEGWGRPDDYYATTYLFALYGAALALLLASALITLTIISLRRRSRADIVAVAWIATLYIPLSISVTKAVPMVIAAVPAIGLAAGRLLTLAIASRSLRARAAGLGLLLGTTATALLILAGYAPFDMSYTGTAPALFWPHGLWIRIAPYLLETGLSLAGGIICAGILWGTSHVPQRARTFVAQRPGGDAGIGQPSGTLASVPVSQRLLAGLVIVVAVASLAVYWMHDDLQVVDRPASVPGVVGQVPALGTYLSQHVPDNATVLMTSGIIEPRVGRLMVMFWAHRDVYGITNLQPSAVCPLVALAARARSPAFIMTYLPYKGQTLGAVDGWKVYKPSCPGITLHPALHHA